MRKIYIFYTSEDLKERLIQRLAEIREKYELLCTPFDKLKPDDISIADERSNTIIIEINKDTIIRALSLYLFFKLTGNRVFLVEKTTHIFSKTLKKRIKNYLKVKELNTKKLIKLLKKPINEVSLLEMGFKIGYIEIGTNPSEKLAYYKSLSEKKDKPTIFFFHGITAQTTTYMRLLNLLTKHYNVIGVDLPYHGLSFNPTKLQTYDEFAYLVFKGVVRLMIKHKIKSKKVILMGHSTGGGVALYLTHLFEKHGFYPYHLVLINPAGFPIKDSAISLFLHGIISRLFSLKEYPLKDPIVKKAVATVILNIYEKIISEHIGLSKFLTFSIKAIPQGFKNVSQYHIKTPTTFIYSTKDVFFDKEYVLNYLQIFDCVRVRRAKGLHDWVIKTPKQLLPWLPK